MVNQVPSGKGPAPSALPDPKWYRPLYPFEPHYVEIDGFNYHYVDEGQGPPVVMLHGNPTWSFYFRNLISALTPNYRVIVPDHMGCGLSDKPPPDAYGYRLADRVRDVELLLDHLGLTDPITLVLHDWGGMIGVCYALNHIEAVARLVILNTAGFLPPPGKKLPWRLQLVRNIPPLAVMGVLGLNLFARCALFMASAKGLSTEVKHGLIAPYNSWKNRMATLKFVQDIPLTMKDPSYPLVKHADQHLHHLAHLPMLICWGMRDFVFDKDYLHEWQRRFPSARVKRYPRAGHYVLEDARDEILVHIKEFLNLNQG